MQQQLLVTGILALAKEVLPRLARVFFQELQQVGRDKQVGRLDLAEAETVLTAAEEVHHIFAL